MPHLDHFTKYIKQKINGFKLIMTRCKAIYRLLFHGGIFWAVT